MLQILERRKVIDFLTEKLIDIETFREGCSHLILFGFNDDTEDGHIEVILREQIDDLDIDDLECFFYELYYDVEKTEPLGDATSLDEYLKILNLSKQEYVNSLKSYYNEEKITPDLIVKEAKEESEWQLQKQYKEYLMKTKYNDFQKKAIQCVEKWEQSHQKVLQKIYKKT